jgi:hypothetical protein
MGDDRSGPTSALVYFASGVTADDVADDVVRDFIRERATAVLMTIGMSQGGTASPRSEVRPTWFADLWIVPPGPADESAKGAILVGERGALLVVDPDGDDVTMMRNSEVVRVGEPGKFGLARFQHIPSESADG